MTSGKHFQGDGASTDQPSDLPNINIKDGNHPSPSSQSARSNLRKNAAEAEVTGSILSSGDVAMEELVLRVKRWRKKELPNSYHESMR